VTSINLPIPVLDAELIVVELIVSEVPARRSIADAKHPKGGKRGVQVVVRDMQRVLRTILWGAGEHVQNTRKEMKAT
jgi:hypothetical protein